MDDGREGHYGQRHIRHIVEEGLDELVFDGFADKGQRQHTARPEEQGRCRAGDAELR